MNMLLLNICFCERFWNLYIIVVITEIGKLGGGENGDLSSEWCSLIF